MRDLDTFASCAYNALRYHHSAWEGLMSALAEAAARTSAIRTGRVLLYDPEAPGFARDFVPEDEDALSLPDVLGSPLWLAFPSSLCLPLSALNWVYAGFPDGRPRLGTAQQASRFAYSKRLEPGTIEFVAGWRIRGTCLFVGGPPWRLVQALAFPAWCGV